MAAISTGVLIQAIRGRWARLGKAVEPGVWISVEGSIRPRQVEAVCGSPTRSPQGQTPGGAAQRCWSSG